MNRAAPGAMPGDIAPFFSDIHTWTSGQGERGIVNEVARARCSPIRSGDASIGDGRSATDRARFSFRMV